MQYLEASTDEVTGPTRFQGTLPIPQPRPPYFGQAGLSQQILEAREAFYVDEAVLAFPRVEDAPIEDVPEKALYVREPYTSKPGVKPFLPAPASHPEVPQKSVIRPESILDLTDRLNPNGTLSWEVPEGDWTVLRFGRRNTGANTRPAPLPGLGFECDKFDKAALEAHFDNFIGKLLRAVGPRPLDRTSGWTMLHIDSWEMGSQNWTEGFGQEFLRRRGYSPVPYLPTLTGRVVESLEVSERFLWDLRLTAQELVIENHASHLKELAGNHGFGLSIEPYDMNPTSDLTLGGVADVPMCEFWSQGYGFDSDFTCFEAVSVAHTLGRPIVAAEAFTADSKEAWNLYPATMKNQGDWALCTGINRIVFHRFAHQPWLDRKPGMTMGPYGVHWDRTQTWWPMVSAYHHYLARCQFLLRQGTPVADICYLVPEGAPHVFRPPASAFHEELRDRRGYNFDGCAPETFLQGADVEDGKIVFPSGVAYRLLVLPDFETMTPALLAKVKELVEKGATVVGPPPAKSPSLSGYPECDTQVQSLAKELWGQFASPAETTWQEGGKGRIVWGGDLSLPPSENPDRALYPNYDATARILESLDVPPDFESDGPVRYTHRQAKDVDIYFVANRTDEPVDAECVFRVDARQPELWDPVGGTQIALTRFEIKDGRTTLPLQFAPHQSFFIVFQGEPQPRSGQMNTVRMKEIHRIEDSWRVTFDPGLGGPGEVTFETLNDWSDNPDPGIKYYSGIAVYRKTFDFSGELPTGDRPIWLDTGEIPGMGRVRINGRELGILWCAPWRVEIAEGLKPDGNRLEIEVANLWPNRLIGDKVVSPEDQIAWTTWNPYQADSELLPSGLLGPVRILTEE
jgi:hypothetical protein